MTNWPDKDENRPKWYDGYGPSIKKVIIENGVTTIGSAAFADCSNLSSIIISENVGIIGRSAFINCNSLTVVYFGTKEQWEEITIEDDNEPIKDATKHYWSWWYNNYKYITYLGKTNYFPYANDLVDDPSLIVVFGDQGDSNQITWYTEDEGWMT